MSDDLPLARATSRWFDDALGAPTEVQRRGWPEIAAGHHALLCAPTGSGKTLAAFLWFVDQLGTTPPVAEKDRCRVLYVSPLKALTVDVERNLRAPIRGIALEAARHQEPFAEPRTAVRSGDTPAADRRDIVRHPPDILITTPESLYLMLTSAAREVLRSVRAVIVDEIHALAGSKRGAHLALSLERLAALTAADPQRIGLSATQRPLSEVARFLGGGGRDVAIVDAGVRKQLELSVEVPVDDMTDLDAGADPGGAASATRSPRRSIWPAITPRLLELIRAHRSTIVFVNSRRLAERLSGQLNDLAGEELVRAHHGSIAREQRLVVEEMLKSGRLPAIVATSSLELGIDMGAVDLVVQVGSPGTVASGLQRIGRSGHSVGAASRGTIFPTHRADLVETAAIAERMLAGDIEETRVPRNPLDVLAQQVVAMVAMDVWDVEDLRRTVTRAYPFSELGIRAFDATLDMLDGRFPSEEFGELRGRIVWDRVAGTVRGRAGAQRLAVTSGGTIPDRGLYSVNIFDDGRRVGELDEEMVYELRPGETFILGATTWRCVDITPQQVLVSPAPGESGTVTPSDGRTPWALPSAPWYESCAPPGIRPRSPVSGPVLNSTNAPRATWSITSTSRRLQPAPFPTTAPSSWSVSVTSSATGDCACCRHSAPVFMLPGRWWRRSASVTTSAATCRQSTAMTVLRCASPTWTICPVRHSCSSTPTRSQTPSSSSSRAAPSSRRVSARTRPVPSCCHGDGRVSVRRCGSSASAAPASCRWCCVTPPSRSLSRPTGSASATCSTSRAWPGSCGRSALARYASWRWRRRRRPRWRRR
jgi:hypothetical protein